MSLELLTEFVHMKISTGKKVWLMKSKKIVAVCVCMMIVLTTLFGCNKKIYITTGLKQNEIFKLSGEPCSLAEVLLVLMTEKSRYEKDLGTEIWSYSVGDDSDNLEDEIKSKVKSQMAELKTVELLAKQEKILLSDSEKERLALAAKEYFDTLTEETKRILGVTENDVRSLYTSFYMADRLYEKLTGNADIEISDEEARVIQIRYIFISTASTSRLNEAVAQLEGGSDFLTVATQYSEGDTDDIYLSKGSTNEDIEKAAFGLKTGEISSVVETEDGYYIILCMSDYLEDMTAENKILMKEKYKKEVYNSIYIPFESEQTFEFNDKVWDNIHFEDYTDVVTSSLYDVYNKAVTE